MPERSSDAKADHDTRVKARPKGPERAASPPARNERGVAGARARTDNGEGRKANGGKGWDHRSRGQPAVQRKGQTRRAAAPVKACVTPALARRSSHALAASGQVLHKPRGRKPRRTPRWWSGAAAMAIGLRWRGDPIARGASPRPRGLAQVACGAPLCCGSGQQRGILGRRSSSVRSSPAGAVFGVELIGRDGARS